MPDCFVGAAVVGSGVGLSVGDGDGCGVGESVVGAAHAQSPFLVMVLNLTSLGEVQNNGDDGL